MSVASLEKGVEPLIKTVYRGWVIKKEFLNSNMSRNTDMDDS